MGISTKWIKSLVGIKKHEKAQNAESSEARSSAALLLLKRKHSMDTEAALAVEELTVQTEPLASDTNTQTVSNSTSSPSTSLQVSQTELDTKEHQAATVIQSAFRAFLVLYSIFGYHVVTDIKKSIEYTTFRSVDKYNFPTHDAA